MKTGNGENAVIETLDTVATGGGRKVTLSDNSTVLVSVCTGRVLPKMLRFVGKLSTDLGLSIKDSEGIKDRLLEKLDDVGFILQLIANYSDDVYDLAGSMSSLKDAEAVAELPLDDIAKVIANLVEVNRDFFTNRVLPVIGAAMRGPAL